MAKKSKKRRAWTAIEVRELKALAKKKTAAAKIARKLKRTEGATRQKAFSIGLSLDSRSCFHLSSQALVDRSAPACKRRPGAMMCGRFWRRPTASDRDRFTQIEPAPIRLGMMSESGWRSVPKSRVIRFPASPERAQSGPDRLEPKA
jgi:hypothetical protein